MMIRKFKLMFQIAVTTIIIAKVLQELYNLDKAAGQLFCGSYTTLGFASALHKVVSIERDMKLENILAHFMVDIDADSKHGSFSGQALDMMLKSLWPQTEVEKVTELANLVRRKYFVSQKIFRNITYNP